MTVKVLIADDHAVVRDGLKMIVESQVDLSVVGIACDGREVVECAEKLHPDVALMDISMPGLNGIEASRLIKQRVPGVRIVILSMHHTTEHIFRAMHAGAQGYLLKESAGSDVIIAIRTVMKGQRFFGRGVELPQDILSCDIDAIPKSPLETLSQREREVLQYVVEGKTSAEIADLLLLSPKSVETYRSRLMLKLGIANIPALVNFALQNGITPAA